jgi:hypothetical protein
VEDLSGSCIAYSTASHSLPPFHLTSIIFILQRQGGIYCIRVSQISFMFCVVGLACCMHGNHVVVSLVFSVLIFLISSRFQFNMNEAEMAVVADYDEIERHRRHVVIVQYLPSSRWHLCKAIGWHVLSDTSWAPCFCWKLATVYQVDPLATGLLVSWVSILVSSNRWRDCIR